jgi:tRNA A37 threonylcarbamoyladenosine modification protein TsaB
MIITTSSLELIRTDGTKLYIEIDPVAIQEEGQKVYTGVYQLQATRYDDPIKSNAEDNPGDTIDIGSFAHHLEDKYEWTYLGDFLDEEEQSQIAAHIQHLDDNDQEARK